MDEALLDGLGVTAPPGAVLSMVDVAALIETFGHPLNRARRVRLDLRHGLDARLEGVVDVVRRVGLRTTVCMPIAAPDLGYVREGSLTLDRRLVTMLARLVADPDVEVAFLADPAQIISRCLTRPETIWEQAGSDLADAGIPVVGIATSFADDSAWAYQRLWTYQVAGRGTADFDVTFAPAFRAPEWNSPGGPKFQGIPSFHDVSDLDGLDRVWLVAETAGPGRFSRMFMSELDTRPEIEWTLACDAIIASSRVGWILLTHDDQRILTADEAITFLEGANGDVRLVVDLTDVAATSLSSDVHAGPAPGEVRTLPYPYDQFLALNSDVDWSTPAQVERQIGEIADHRGLATAGSAYLHSPGDQWVAFGNRQPDMAKMIRQWAVGGALDTIHSLSATMSPTAFQRMGTVRGGEVWRATNSVDPVTADGIMVALEGGSSSTLTAAPNIEVADAAGWHTSLPLSSWSDSGALSYALYLLDHDVTRPFNTVLLAGSSEMISAVRSVSTTFATAGTVARTLEDLQRDHIAVPVFTAHGGGRGSRTIGACLSDNYRRRFPEDVGLAMDTPGTPFYVLPSLRAAGVFFFNPIGWFGTRDADHLRDLVRVSDNADGTQSYVFRRFCSRRHADESGDDLWAYDKKTSSAQGLGANIDDLLQRFHWAPPGHGCVLYTHLGHNVGNQITDRLAWPEEAHAAFDRLSEYVYARDQDDPVRYRLWFTSASRICAHALMQKSLASHLSVDGDVVRITSWHDDVLDLPIPDPSTFDLGWLHGTTIYVKDSATASVMVDDVVVNHLTRNPTDSKGGQSVTIVDGGNRIPVISGAASPLQPQSPSSAVNVGTDGSLRWREPVDVELQTIPVSLRNVTHWTLQVLESDEELQVGLKLANGTILWASKLGGVKPQKTGAEPATYTWSLAAGQRTGLAPPAGGVVAIRLRAGGAGEVAAVELIRPLPVGFRSRDGRILAGQRRDLAGVPVPGTVQLDVDGTTRTVQSDLCGRFRFAGIFDGALAVLSVDGPAWFPHGSEFRMIGDRWDADVVLFDQARQSLLSSTN